MRRLNLFFGILFLTFALSMFNNPVFAGAIDCNWRSSFKYPQANAKFEAGKAVYVKVDAQKYQDIEYMELYVDGKLIRKESTYPYEWCKGNGKEDGYLRNLKAGVHKIECRIKDKCGKINKIETSITIDSGGPILQPGSQCRVSLSFNYPKTNGMILDSLFYVKADVVNQNEIEYVELFLNNTSLGKDTKYPFQWGKGAPISSRAPKYLQPGSYKLKAVIKDKCGEVKEVHSNFTRRK